MDKVQGKRKMVATNLVGLSKQDVIDEIKNQIYHAGICFISELENEVKIIKEQFGYEIQPYEDVLGPMGWNCCDKCGILGNSEEDFLWLDFYEWDDDNPEDQKLLKALEKEKEEYCAICWECVEVLKH